MSFLTRRRRPAPAPAPATASDAQVRVSAPGPLRLLMEARAPLEYAAMLAARPWLNRLPVGDGHPVIVFPGLGAADLTTVPLRRFLRQRGYTPYAWQQGFNFGPRRGVLDHCRALFKQIAQRHGEAVSLIGWSLGGIYARELAKEQPANARCVITLGTPFVGQPRATNVEYQTEATLPPGWDQADLRVALAFGDTWIGERRSAVLVVPSVVARREGNVLINPQHPDIRLIVAGRTESVIWDARLFGRH